ncbi:MAG: tRNA (adenosine(37)-N6)-threonylcarbamoyltransferase complex dimerization subunit type 1 TsaB [Cyanobacteriota bacterium]|nr:tRNA (adenosine(37)-N6)-threonylcarbamoyltransferase complex dimerization subunit type 1 TsaB [Cyanobacteriota bacterium]
MNSDLWILALHTTTPSLGLALWPLSAHKSAQVSEQGIPRHQSWWLDRELAAQLHPLLQAWLPPQTWAGLAAIAVATGPGSFTGCRLGVTVARTLGQTLHLPVFGVSSLAALAQQYFRQQPTTSPTPLAVSMDAQRGEYYGGIYQWDPITHHLHTTVADQLWTAAAWQTCLADQGNPPVQEAPTSPATPPTLGVAEWAARAYQQGSRPAWQGVLPTYLRRPPIHS